MSKYVLIIALVLLSCQSPSPKIDQSKNENSENSWELIEKIANQRSHKDEILKILGTPSDTFERKQTTDEFWTFNDAKTGQQRWSINFALNDLVSTIVYIPQKYEKNYFSIDAILEHWKDYKCEEKTVQRLSPGLVKRIKYYDCGNGRKFFFNQWNEVYSINIPTVAQPGTEKKEEK